MRFKPRATLVPGLPPANYTKRKANRVHKLSRPCGKIKRSKAGRSIGWELKVVASELEDLKV